MKSSIGIIGGADGPTAIFIAAPVGGSLFMIGCALMLTAVGILLYRKRKNK